MKIIPVSLDAHMEYAERVQEELRRTGVRVELDVREEKLGYKIRESQMKKIPYTLVLGDKEQDTDEVNIRSYGSQDTHTAKIGAFVASISEEITK